MKKMILTAVAALSVLAFPVTAGAKPGDGNGSDRGQGHSAPEQATEHGSDDRRGAQQDDARGQDGREHSADDRRADGDTPAADQRGEDRPAPRRCKRPQSVGFVAKGSLASFTPEDVTLDVKRANRHARGYIKAAGSTFALGVARVRFVGVTDADGSGAVDFADVLGTDTVVAIGKAVRPKRGCEGETVLKLRKLQVVRPDAEEPDDSDESEQS